MAVQGQLNFEERPAASAGRRGRPPGSQSPDLVARNRKILRAFQAGKCISQIAQEQILSERYIRDIIKKAGWRIPDKRRREFPSPHRRDLTGRDRDILRRVQAGKTYESIAQDFGITRQRVSQIIKRAYKEG